MPALGESNRAPAWWLYMLQCSGDKLYAGITTDLEVRMRAHASGKGAKYTRANPPVRVVATRGFPDRSTASKAEYALKQLPRHRKAAFFATDSIDEDTACSKK